MGIAKPVQLLEQNPITSTDNFSILASADTHGYMSDFNVFGSCIEAFNSDAAVLLGDICESRWSDIGENLSNYHCWDDTLRIVGNHDVLKDAIGWDWTNQATQTEVYTRFFANDNPVAMQENTTYWAKRFADKNTMVIGGNCMLIGESNQQAQYTFFETALETALANDDTVIICYHWPLNVSLNSLNTNFSIASVDSFYNGDAHGELKSQTQTFENSLLALVDDFISQGGKFACWLCGHEHRDDVGVYNGEYKQLYISLTSYHYLNDLINHSINDYTDGLAFDRIEILPESETVKIYRYGANYGDNFGHLTTLEMGWRGEIVDIGIA